ncbi:unnamed protein product, partial [Iphiclides podalirius]
MSKLRKRCAKVCKKWEVCVDGGPDNERWLEWSARRADARVAIAREAKGAGEGQGANLERSRGPRGRRGARGGAGAPGRRPAPSDPRARAGSASAPAVASKPAPQTDVPPNAPPSATGGAAARLRDSPLRLPARPAPG